MEAGCRREQQTSTGKGSARRGARRSIRWVVARIALLIILRKRARVSWLDKDTPDAVGDISCAQVY